MKKKEKRPCLIPENVQFLKDKSLKMTAVADIALGGLQQG